MTLALQGIASFLPAGLAVQQTARHTAAAPFVAYRTVGIGTRCRGGPAALGCGRVSRTAQKRTSQQQAKPAEALREGGSPEERCPHVRRDRAPR